MMSATVFAHLENCGTVNSCWPMARCMSDTSMTPISRCGKRRRNRGYCRTPPPHRRSFVRGWHGPPARRRRRIADRFPAALDLLTAHDGVDIRHLVEIVDEGLQFQSGSRPDAGLQRAGQQFRHVAELLQRAVGKFPGTRRGKGHRIVCRVEIEQQFRAETQERDQALVDIVG